ncbi:MAG: DUF1611 domain-containing protein [Fimbriimonadaceae bacterium]
MLERHQKLALYMEGALTEAPGKMGFGLLRYSPNPVACVIDSRYAGQNVQDVIDTPRSCPVVATIAEAVALGSEVFVLGIAPAGGLIPEEWWPVIDDAVASGLSIVNGLHDPIGPRYPGLFPHPPAPSPRHEPFAERGRLGQWIWDIRIEPSGLGVGTAAAAGLTNRRVLMIGTDMNVGKMTAGLEIHRLALERGIKSEFVATGQIGVTIMGSGVPLDAVRVDFASGAMEREMLRTKEADLVIVEGQGALIHPGSTANLPLLRGTCPTHLILCHRARQGTLQRNPSIKIPPLRDYLKLYEDLSEACGTFPRPVSVGVALNTANLPEDAAQAEIERIEETTGLPCTDPVRFGAAQLLEGLG